MEGICLFWKKLLNSLEGKSAGGFSVKQVNEPKPLVKRRPQETDFGTKVKKLGQCFNLWGNLWRNWYIYPIIVPDQLTHHLKVVRLVTCRAAFLARPGKFSGP